MVKGTCTKLIGKPPVFTNVGIIHSNPRFPYCLKDKAQPETQATSFGNVLFNAKLAVDDPEAIVGNLVSGSPERVVLSRL